ncbi:hypothetical protein [Neolewinella antarctica]|uniref:UPF0323 domain-containing protein n=1 Tax=Neolewinella antarctica TaxID=442734 RepID=A0ABX0X8X9_9BACT|nr:hypothetical protein [Neolewinella antarctica]NJC25718.1 hypothetical protein [Neolewinella antarctica]
MQKSFLRALLACGLGLSIFSCTTDTADTGWDEPTTGVITTVREVNAGNFKIASEDPVPTVTDSRIIIQPLDGNVDTLTLEEAKLVSQNSDTTSTRSRAVRGGGMGFFGYMMLGRMMGGGINRGAYVNGAAYNRANSTAGSSVRGSARRTGGSSRNSGFGSGRSTRSVGG